MAQNLYTALGQGGLPPSKPSFERISFCHWQVGLGVERDDESPHVCLSANATVKREHRIGACQPQPAREHLGARGWTGRAVLETHGFYCGDGCADNPA
jgi:hypothetical protein